MTADEANFSRRKMIFCRKLRRQSGHSLGEIGIAVFLLTVMALLISNCFVLDTAKKYNDEACRKAIESAARAALSGKDALAVQIAAQDGLNKTSEGGYFIEHPTFLEYKDEKNDGVRQLKVQTQTVARVPFPILVLDDNDIREHGALAFKSTCIVQLDKKPQ